MSGMKYHFRGRSSTRPWEAPRPAASFTIDAALSPLVTHSLEDLHILDRLGTRPLPTIDLNGVDGRHSTHPREDYDEASDRRPESVPCRVDAASGPPSSTRDE